MSESKILPDVFISYSHADSDWVRDWLLPRLKKAGFNNVYAYELSPIVGMPILRELGQLIEQSRYIVPVLSPAYSCTVSVSAISLLLYFKDSRGRVPVKRSGREGL